MKTLFFFYHNLKNESKINQLNFPCYIENGSILVGSYDEKIGHLTKGNHEMISGKLVSFNASLQEVLQELNNPNHSLGTGKTKYELSTILVNVNNRVKEAFIIF
jgi:hypothetical protein